MKFSVKWQKRLMEKQKQEDHDCPISLTWVLNSTGMVEKQCRKWWLVICMMFKAISTLIQSGWGGQCINPFFPGVLFTSTPYNILSKPLAAFPLFESGNNEQLWERNDSCGNDYQKLWKEYWSSWGSNPQPPILKSCMLLTELHRLGCGKKRWKVWFAAFSPFPTMFSRGQLV